MAPYFGDGLKVETWIRGESLGTYCSEQYEVLDVQELSVADGAYTWPETKDHSKWGES